MKILKYSLLTAVLGVVLWSCKKELKIITKDTTNTEIEYLKIAGKEHNKGLDFVLKEIKKTNNPNFDNSEALLNSIENYTRNFLRKESEIMNNSSSIDAIRFSLISFVDLKNNQSENFKEEEEALKLWDPSVEESLTEKQKELLTILGNATYNVDLDIEATLSVFEKVRIKATNECSENELLIIIAAIEVGKNSLIYWSENYQSWIDAFTSNPPEGWFNWKKVGGADIKGAVTGAVTAAITGVGIGIGALGGGVGASAGAAALELWNHWV